MNRQFHRLPLLAMLFLGLGFFTAACTRVEVGNVVKDEGVKCMVAAVDEDNRPTLLLTLEERPHIAYDSALCWAAAIGQEGEWKLPTSEQLQQLWNNRDVLNEKAERQGLSPMLQRSDFYWSSTSAGEGYVYALGLYGIRAYFVHGAYYKARAVKTLQY